MAAGGGDSAAALGFGEATVTPAAPEPPGRSVGTGPLLSLVGVDSPAAPEHASTMCMCRSSSFVFSCFHPPSSVCALRLRLRAVLRPRSILCAALCALHRSCRRACRPRACRHPASFALSLSFWRVSCCLHDRSPIECAVRVPLAVPACCVLQSILCPHRGTGVRAGGQIPETAVHISDQSSRTTPATSSSSKWD